MELLDARCPVTAFTRYACAVKGNCCCRVPHQKGYTTVSSSHTTSKHARTAQCIASPLTQLTTRTPHTLLTHSLAWHSPRMSCRGRLLLPGAAAEREERCAAERWPPQEQQRALPGTAYGWGRSREETCGNGRVRTTLHPLIKHVRCTAESWPPQAI